MAAEVTMYMKIDGIDGNITAKGHEKWIQIYGMGFNVARSVSSNDPGNETDREASIPSFSTIDIVKVMDETSPKLFLEVCLGGAKKVQIHLCHTGDNIQSFMEYTLTNVLFTDYNVRCNDGSHVESLSLNYTKLEMNYKTRTSADKQGTAIPAAYDLATASK